MFRWCARILMLGAAGVLAAAQPAAAQTDPMDIIDRVDRLMRGDSSRGVATMEVVTEHWEREMTMEVWSLGTDYSLVRLRAPRRDAGTATLMAGDDIWNYLPKVDRTIKIPASMMGGSWMGSHFTNDDLVKESRLVDDYDVEMAFEGERDGVDVWELRLTPKPEAAVVWGHMAFLVRQRDSMPLWARYYDEDGELARTMEYSAFTEMGGRLVPGVMDMVPADKPEERTSFRYEELEFDVDLDTSFFSLRTLQRGR
jgi:hypothetical protein